MTKKILPSIFLFAFILLLPVAVHGQCKQFAKKTCKVGLHPYQHDGNYHAALLIEGEEAELYKTFYSDTDYRLGICGAGNLSDIEFRVVDSSGKILHDNTLNNMEWKWDFKLESSQQLKIVVRVPVPEGEVEEPSEGCVAIMFGFLD